MGNPMRPTHIVVNQDDDVVTVLNTQSGCLMLTNMTGKRILMLCDGHHSEEQIVSALRSDFPSVDRQEIASDVRSFLQTAAEKRVVT